MPYNFSGLKLKAKETEEWLKKEFAAIRTGRATPALLDSVTAESYGARVALKTLGAINIEDVRSLRLTLWDKTQMKSVESAITAANLGVSVTADATSLRVIFPELTADKRKLLQKAAHDKTEEARVSLRQERERVWHDIQSKEKEGNLTEDEKFHFKDELQKIVDEGNKQLDEIAKRKEVEITS
ncbi:MAG: ribosome recycling factor [Candidatus Vogelbacteria bacterium]|nr:ribosome recycling factor [Candidatus Vogelbacteria bacterium]